MSDEARKDVPNRGWVDDACDMSEHLEDFAEATGNHQAASVVQRVAKRRAQGDREMRQGELTPIKAFHDWARPHADAVKKAREQIDRANKAASSPKK